MKKLISLALVMTLMLALAGCGVSQSDYDAVCAERDDLKDQIGLLNAAPETVHINISGEFVATVRDLIPNYTLDGTTPMTAVVTRFQMAPFALPVNDLAEELEIGETYVFILKPRENVEMSQAEWESVVYDVEPVVSRYYLAAASVREVTDEPADYYLITYDEVGSKTSNTASTTQPDHLSLIPQTPSTDPVETVRSVIEAQAEEEYAISIQFEAAQIDVEETAFTLQSLVGSERAKEMGWSDAYLSEHYTVVRATYFAEYDHTKTPNFDGHLEQLFYLIRDTGTGKWTVTDMMTASKLD